MDINGNVHADLLAKESLNLEFISVTLCPSKSEFHHILNYKFKENWKESWSCLPTGMTAFKPEPNDCHYIDLPRCQQVAISRIRLNTTVLTHKHYFNTHAAIYVLTVTYLQLLVITSSLTVPNILLVAIIWNLLVAISIDKPLTKETILSPVFPYQDIIKFLKTSNLLHMI